MPSRATTWTDWTTNGPGQMRSKTLGIGFLPKQLSRLILVLKS